ncbi:MAG: selenocysteine-specific translation elongation factor [Chthoniobacterales bacterium]
MTNFILATAGHVDHGKSALVKALTGTDPDRLPEEKARGITIDLGFSELNLTAPNGEQFHVGIVDVPGHEDFVRNMLAGVGSVNVALLAVAADDGWMPQTEEHFQIITYLDVKRIVVALTKSDLGKIDIVTSQIHEQLRGTPFADSQIISTSVRTGDGIENLKSALAAELARLPRPRDIDKPRLFVDRAFSLQGIGTVVTGTLTGGKIESGQTIIMQSANISTRARSIQSHGRDVDLAEPSMRTAINLPDLALDQIKRGDVITAAAHETTSILEVVLTRSSRLRRAPAMKTGGSAYIHHGTTRALAKVVFTEAVALSAGESAIAQLRLERPLAVFVGGRLIVRDASEQHTIAGGIVFDIDAGNSLRAKQRAILATRATAPDDVALAVWTEISCRGIIEPATMLERSCFSGAEIARALQKLAEHGEIFLSENICAKMLVWRELRECAAQFIDAAHKSHPERRGVELNDLRTELSSISPAVFDALIVDLCRTDFVRAGSVIARRSHRASLPPALKAAAEKIRAGLSAKPFDPPGRESVANKNDAALRFLIDNGEIVEVAPEVVLLREYLEQMKTQAVEFISANGPATASQLREKLGTSRRIIIPFLEYLDRIGVTQRTGDLRQLRETKSAAVARQ